MTDYSFQTLHSDGGARVIFRGVVGSRAYGTDRPGSDEDMRGVFLVPPLEYALLAAPPEQVADERNDRVYYSLRRFAELAAASNPNVLELFWLPPDCVRLDTPRFVRLRENRALFLSRRAVDTHIGYALAQIKKALFEWLGSPIVYLDRDNFGDRLRALVPRFFDPRGAAWHHLAMQRSALADLAPDGTIRIKKLCYALSVRWIVARASMPPVPFPELFAASDLDPAARAAVEDVLVAKRDASERDCIAMPLVLSELFENNENLVPEAEFPKRERARLEGLNELLKDIVVETNRTNEDGN